MRIIIDWDLCRGHGACMGEAPEIFEVDAHGKLTVRHERPPAAQRAAIERAAQYCPTGAISVEGDP